MKNARLVEAGILAINVLFIAIAGWVAIKVSWLIAIPTFLALLIGLTIFIYRYDAWLVRRLSSDEEPLLIGLCKSGFVGRVRRITRFLPSDPRCRFCLIPFGGVGKVLGIKPALYNPNFCRSCFEGLPAKTIEMEVGVLFADMRGFTAWSEEHSPAEAAAMLTCFYDVAAREITRNDALMAFIGDQVMALYPVCMRSLGDDTAKKMFESANRLVRRIKFDPNILDVGVGLNLGVAQVGSMAVGKSRNFTAVGDSVNTAARFQSQAKANEILFSESVCLNLAQSVPGSETRLLDLKGKTGPVKAFALCL